MTQLSRRSLIGSLISFVAAPAIVRAGSLMPVKTMEPENAFEFSSFYSVYPLNVSAEVKALLARRIADAEKVMIENIRMELYGDRLYGISGQSSNIYYDIVKASE